LVTTSTIGILAVVRSASTLRTPASPRAACGWADADEEDADEKWNTPSPGEELPLRQLRQRRQHPGGGEIPDRVAELDHRAKQPAVPGRRVLDHHQHRAATFAAEADALEQAQYHERDGRGDADLPVGRQKTDQEGAEAHDDDGDREHRLAADPVAEMPEDRCAQRPSQ
jgi:hypothetical protein